MEISMVHAVPDHQITTNGCTCHESTATMACAQFRKNHLIRIWKRANWNFHPIGTVMGEIHDDVIKWKHFPRNWPFVWGIHWSPVNSPHKGQWCGALMFSLSCALKNTGVNNCEAGDLRRHLYDVIVMTCKWNPKSALLHPAGPVTHIGENYRWEIKNNTKLIIPT